MWTGASLSYVVIRVCRREVLLVYLSDFSDIYIMLLASTKNEERVCYFNVNISWFAHASVAMLNCNL